MNYYGKTDHVADGRDLTWKAIRPKGLVVPSAPRPHGGFGMDFRDWGMLNNGPSNAWPYGYAANRGCGNCTIVDKLHSLMASAKNAGRPIPEFDDKSAVADYALLVAKTQGGAAYDPLSGTNDTGLQIRDVLTHAQQMGFVDLAGKNYQIGPYVAVEPGNFTEMWELLWFCEHLTLGIQAPRSMEDQVNAGQEITYVPGSPILGGHDILIEGHPVGSMWTGVQWGQRTPMTPEFITRQADECWAWFDPESIRTTLSEDYEGFNAAQVEEYVATIAQTFPATVLR